MSFLGMDMNNGRFVRIFHATEHLDEFFYVVAFL